MAQIEIDVKFWKGELNRAIGYQRDQWHVWEESLNFVTGDWFKNNTTGILLDNDLTPVNYATSYFNILTSVIYARNPYIFVNPNHGKYSGFSQSMEIALNYLWRELNIKTQVKKAIKNAIPFGIGWMDVGYWAEFSKLEIRPQTEINQFEELIDFVKKKEEPLDQEEEGVLNEYIKRESAYAVSLSPYKVLLAPGYHSVSEMPYLILLEDISPIDFAHHPIYGKYKDSVKATKEVFIRKISGLLSTPLASTPTRQKDSTQLIRLAHFWDRRNRARFTMAEDSDLVLAKGSWPYCLEGFPQTPLIFNEIPESNKSANAYPMSDIKPMIPQLRELCLLRTAMVRHRKQSGPVVLMDKNRWTEEDARKFSTEYNLALVPVNDINGVKEFNPPALPEIIYNMNNIILQDLDRQGGLASLLVSQQQGQRLATEVNYQAAGSQSLTSEKVDVIENFSVEIARRLAAIMWEFYPREKIARILGEQFLTEDVWPSLPEEKEQRCRIIQEELAFTIEAGSTMPAKDKAVQRDQFLKFANIVFASAPETIKKSGFVQRLAEEFDEKDTKDWLILDDEGEKQAAMQENELLAQGIPQVVSPNNNHDVHMQIHSLIENPTPASDKHLLTHHQMSLQKLGKLSPQKGDVSAPASAAVPELMRAGVPAYEDITAGVGQGARVPGLDTGGISNL